MTWCRSSRALAAVAALSLVAGGLASANTTGETSVHAGAARSGVTLTLWHNSADPQAILNLYKRFEKATGTTLNLVSIPADNFETTTQTKWATGARPDILEYHAAQSSLLPLNPLMTMRDLSGEAYIAKSGTLYQSAGTVNGKVFAAIIGFPQVFGMYYNKTVFKKAGLKPPTSYADLLSDCTAIKAKVPGVAPIFEAGGSLWPPQILAGLLYMGQFNMADSYGQAVRSHKQTLSASSSPFVAGLTAYNTLRGKGCFNGDIVTAKFEDSMKALLSGTAAMVAQHSDMIPTLDEDANGSASKVDATIGFVGISATKPVATYAPSPLGTYYLPKTGDSNREKAALDFIHFVTGSGYASYVQDAKSFPIIKGVPAAKGVQGLAQDVKKAYDKGATLAFNSNIPGFGGFAALTSQLIAGQVDPQGVASRMQQEVAQAAKAAGISGW